MTSTISYRFRRVTPHDLALLGRWRKNPHVREWWDSDEPNSVKALRDPRVVRWIVAQGDHPFAYIQDYTVHGWDDHHFFDLPAGSRGIDQFIGDPEMIGMGHGSRFVKQRMEALFEAGAPIIATDPHPDNKRAIAAYKKVGFARLGPAIETKWGLILPMAARRLNV